MLLNVNDDLMTLKIALSSLFILNIVIRGEAATTGSDWAWVR